MKVALVTSYLSSRGGGVSAVVERLSSALLKLSGYDVQVFGLEDPLWKSEGESSWNGGPVSSFKVLGPSSFGYAPALTNALIEWEPAIVHTHGIWMHPSRSVLQWKLITRKPHIVSPHGMLDDWALRNSPLRKKIAGLFYENAHLGSANVIHALCDEEKASARNIGLRQSVAVIANGVDFPKEMPTPPAPWEPLKVPGTRVLLFLGRLHVKKNIVPFLKAWSFVKSESPNLADWHLVIAGWDQGDHARLIRTTVEDLNLIDSVTLTGPFFGPEKDAAFRNACAFVLPSVSEGLPVAVLEAWSYRLPALITDACNLRGAFAAGAAYHLRTSEQGMKDDLSTFLHLSNNKLHEIGNCGFMMAQHRYDWATIAANMASLYNITVRSNGLHMSTHDA